MVLSPITTLPNFEGITSALNQGSESLQIISRNVALSGVGNAGGSFVAGESSVINTAVDANLSFSLQISTTAACAILLHADVSVTYGA